MAYLPIENYGIVGDMHSAALVGINASIDWFCFPRFDSPSVFAAILDDEKGGRFNVSPAIDGVKSKQVYWPDTNVLLMRFLSSAGIAEVIDYMPVVRRRGDLDGASQSGLVVSGPPSPRTEALVENGVASVGNGPRG
jgi:GH15 family glucan-1,4-alpha-glucosidase